MAGITVENLKILLKTAAREQREERDNASTFLEVIGRSRRETYVSSLLAYAIRKDDALLTKLLQYGLKDSAPEIAKNMPEIADKDVTCEYAMSGGRTDIFVTGKFAGGDAFTLTIENKIDSWEHGGQTTVYYNYVNTRYTKSENAFIYLTPYDGSACECGQFEVLTYKELFGMITDGTDGIIDDFKQHIKRNFSGKEVMKDSTLQILENYSGYKKLFAEAERAVNGLRNAIRRDLAAIYKDGYLVENRKQSIWVNRPEWEGNDYWFYAELYFKEYDLNAVSVKATAAVYHRNKEIIEFCDNSGGGFWDNGGNDAVKEYFTFKEVPFFYTGDGRIFSEEWKGALTDFACRRIPEMMDLLDKEFSNFQIFLNK